MGKILAICTSSRRGTAKTAVPSAVLTPEWGIVGDAHGGSWHRQVSLLSVEKIEAFRAKIWVDYGAFGENLVVEGFDFAALPVVDQENRLVGIITFDDAMDVIEEETTEDFEKMAAMLPSDKPYLRAGVFDTWKARMPWLLILMLSATFTGMILNHYENALAACLVLNAYIPMLSGTGGNSGTQASVAVIRALSLDAVDFSDIFQVLWKELRVSLLCGVCLAAANFVKMMVVDRWLMNKPEVTVPVAFVS